MFGDGGTAQMTGAENTAKVAFQQSDAGVFDGDVGAGAHGDADIGGGQRGASLMPSPAMATTWPSRRSARDEIGLLLRLHFGFDLIDAGGLHDFFCCRATVPGGDHYVDASRAEFANRGGSGRFMRSAKASAPTSFWFIRDEHFRAGLHLDAWTRRCWQRRRYPAGFEKLNGADPDGFVLDRPSAPPPGVQEIGYG